jgi:adenylate cyclase
MKDDAVAPDDPSSAVERRLATILMADVFGYSRMMGEDEERTVRIFRGHRAVCDELLKVHRGRVFNTAGDAILAEFPSAVEAVRCATEIQAALRTRNEHLPEEQRMWFRIGINLGDVIIQGGDLLGDGVNVAACIQTIAEPQAAVIDNGTIDDAQGSHTGGGRHRRR